MSSVTFHFVGYLPNQKRRRVNEDKLNINEQDPTPFWEPESRFHHLCAKVPQEKIFKNIIDFNSFVAKKCQEKHFIFGENIS